MREDLVKSKKINLSGLKGISWTSENKAWIKEIHKVFWASDNWLMEVIKIGIWLSGARRNIFPDSRNTIIRWLDEIDLCFWQPNYSGVVEGINNESSQVDALALLMGIFDKLPN